MREFADEIRGMDDAGTLPLTIGMLEALGAVEEAVGDDGRVDMYVVELNMLPTLLSLASLERRVAVEAMERELGLDIRIKRLGAKVAMMRADRTPEPTTVVADGQEFPCHKWATGVDGGMWLIRGGDGDPITSTFLASGECPICHQFLGVDGTNRPNLGDVPARPGEPGHNNPVPGGAE